MIINEPNPLFLLTSTTLNPWPEMANCHKLQFDLEDSFNIKSKERWANCTHWYGILDDDLMTAYNKGNKKYYKMLLMTFLFNQVNQRSMVNYLNLYE